MSRFLDHREAGKIFHDFEKHKDRYLIIHYSCESFFDTNGATPRITAIAVKSPSSGQTDLFAVHKAAELMKIKPEDIVERYEEVERMMLDDFFTFVQGHLDKIWIHWNMRDSNFGFKALEQRYRVLGKVPAIIPDQNKLDMAILFRKYYGKSYIGDPHIKALMDYNGIHVKDFMSGKDEANAFKNHEFIRLSFSCAGKVNLFDKFLTRAIDNELKTQSSFRDEYGNVPLGIYNFANESAWGKFLFWIANLLIGGFAGGYIGKLFF
ncbi:hypothetical protein ACFQ3L_00335 [Lacticaseibacillus jixianensis]|uniref:Uncharacterized protein n=1 Tax=Lacticaseibacillus jixianensis TaxID=2486012 RepID=A0ABW4B5S6_9LACO|nr:hypothetical protein [Lacticaseibacillus jixianensis]